MGWKSFPDVSTKVREADVLLTCAPELNWLFKLELVTLAPHRCSLCPCRQVNTGLPLPGLDLDSGLPHVPGKMEWSKVHPPPSYSGPSLLSQWLSSGGWVCGSTGREHCGGFFGRAEPIWFLLWSGAKLNFIAVTTYSGRSRLVCRIKRERREGWVEVSGEWERQMWWIFISTHTHTHHSVGVFCIPWSA